MFKPKTPITGRLENSSGGAIRTHDLRVMRKKPDFENIERITMQVKPVLCTPTRLTDTICCWL